MTRRLHLDVSCLHPGDRVHLGWDGPVTLTGVESEDSEAFRLKYLDGTERESDVFYAGISFEVEFPTWGQLAAAEGVILDLHERLCLEQRRADRAEAGLRNARRRAHPTRPDTRGGATT